MNEEQKWLRLVGRKLGGRAFCLDNLFWIVL